MDVLYKVCCGIDVHKKLLVACIRDGKDSKVMKFGATTKEIGKLAELILSSGAEKVAMESTASYWKPVYNILETRGISCIVVNAQHMKNVPGKKTDVKDSEWIADLLQHGLLTSSYIPDRNQRDLRELLVYRQSLVQESSAELNRLQKMLEGGNIKLSGTVSDILGKSSRLFLENLICGKHLSADDIRKLQADGAVSGFLKASPEELSDSLDGCLSQMQRESLRDVMNHIDDLSERISATEKRALDSLSDRQKECVGLLMTVPGIKEISAVCIISVIGTDMSQFPTANHLCSWAGVVPGNNESAGKKRSSRCTKGNQLLRAALSQCANAAARKKGCFFKAQYERLVVRRGKGKAKMAVAHSLLICIYHILKEGIEFKDLGEDYYANYKREATIRSISRKIKQLGISKSEIMEMVE